MTKAALEKEFRDRFNKPPDHFFFCPGRVNLIGEHIDYNGGKVMPCAITPGTWLAVARNTEKKIRFRCLNFPETADLQLQSSYSKTGREWFNYPLGVIDAFLQEGAVFSGLDLLYYGDLPIGAGLSSSASIEVLTAYALNEMFGLNKDRPSMAVLGKKVENEFIGLNSGIMDQFAVAMGKKNCALLLDCDTLDYEYLPLDTGDYVLAVINSRKQRSLAESKYNERFRECGEVLKLLKQELAVNNLCEVSSDAFEKHIHLVTDPVLQKRARHVVSENERVKASKQALVSGQLEIFGALMYASHDSLRDLYEVSGRELDTIVGFARNYEGCAGARMTGAGFGGCAIALVKKERFDDFAEKISLFYQDQTGYAPEVFASGIGDGVKELTD